ncbi:hypothetical protein OEZ86_014172 [Tetradesmus obliquus]|nr:hypothetical protein OEZ86_014172 [Tetradesmus obliquus]
MGPSKGVLLLLLLSLCLASTAQAAASNVIRGAQPDQIEKYQPVNGKFTCFDGSKTIDFNLVNDNFCDCPDSSDEPGTSACPNGVFYCRNKGHEPRLLATSFVDDGVCDCCDGTDELSGCKNTCIEKNSAKRDALRAKIDEYKASLEKKGQYAASAAGVREHIKQRHANVDGDIAATEQELQKLTADKKRLEEETEVKRVAHKQQQAELAAQRKAEREAAAVKATEEAAAAAAKAAEEQAAADKTAAEAAAAAEGAAGEGAAAAEHEETDEERGRRIAAQWTNDPAAAGPASDSQAAADEAASQQQQQAVTDEAANDGASYLSRVYSKAKESVQKIIGSPTNADSAESDDADSAAAAGDEDEPPLPYEEPAPEDGDTDEPDWSMNNDSVNADPDYEPFDDSELKKVSEDASAAERKLTELRTEKERVARQVDLTFNDAWAGLMNKCLEARMPQFTYKFCFFDKASQVDNGGGHETSLGLWRGFEKGGTEAVFDGGDYCHKAPARSLRVRLECGSEEKAWDASEPEVCSYAVHASTPAACKTDRLKQLEDIMASLLAEEAALAAEIAAEEAQRQADLAVLRAKIEGGGAHDEL